MDKAKYEELKERQNSLIIEGFKTGNIFLYPDALFDSLRAFSYGGLPASILLFYPNLCNGHCYDRALLMQLAFDDAKVVWADIESLRLQGVEPEHAYVETKLNVDGKDIDCVVDTSLGLIYTKAYYEAVEKPKINKVLSKKQCMGSYEIQSILASDFQSDKWILLLTLPIIEEKIKSGDSLYEEKLLKEIELLKQAINFDAMQQEYEEDRLKSSEELDKKFGIVRDKYGREVSRNGIPNEFYDARSPKEIALENEKIEQMLSDPKQKEKFFRQCARRSVRRMKKTDKNLIKRVKARLKQINKDPEKDVYSM